ncbi:MAG: hypothetical protein K1X89_21490 [Myxococcaceae bacterium]|nr:hypothetical protein [Myxococcaceae bacterium]
MNKVGWAAAVGAVVMSCGGGDAVVSGVHRSTSQWLCEALESSIECSAPLPKQEGERGAYSCVGAELDDACPPPGAVSEASGKERHPELVSLEAATAALPWACLFTGKQQRTCYRDLRQMTKGAGQPGGLEGEGPGGAGSTGGSTAGGGSPGSTSGSGSGGPGSTSGAVPPPPVVPTSCAATSWEPYFAQLASYQYSKNGVCMSFPRSLFDTSASFEALAVETASLPANPGKPSCSAGESAMRTQAWLDAVMAGCSGLDQAILVMCQQAANYAPKSGSCAPTGAW